MKSTWDARRKGNGWSGGMVEWVEGDTAYISAVFSWQVGDVYQKAIWYEQQGYRVRVGGPAVMLNPSGLERWMGSEVDALEHHNPNATFTTRGCIRHCSFCAVHRIEPEYQELDDWKVKPIICDNNLLAASLKHFDSVIDRLKGVKSVDFNQGLDARLLTPYHASRLVELDLLCVRLAWDHIKAESAFMKAVGVLRDAGIPMSKLHAYVLIGFNDTPEDALYRLEKVAEIGGYPNPMRYQPLNSKVKNQHMGENWTDAELKRYMRYWSNLRITRCIPFAEFRHRGEELVGVSREQGALW